MNGVTILEQTIDYGAGYIRLGAAERISNLEPLRMIAFGPPERVGSSAKMTCLDDSQGIWLPKAVAILRPSDQ